MIDRLMALARDIFEVDLALDLALAGLLSARKILARQLAAGRGSDAEIDELSTALADIEAALTALTRWSSSARSGGGGSDWIGDHYDDAGVCDD